MLSLQDIFDEDQVRSDYVSKVKLYGEKHCDHFEWVIATVDNQTREGIRYYFGQSYVDWYIPSDNKGIECFRPYKTRPSALVIHRLFFFKPPRG